jgi:hypothetical protein
MMPKKTAPKTGHTAVSTATELRHYKQSTAYFNSAGSEDYEPSLTITEPTVIITCYADAGAEYTYNGALLKPVNITVPPGQHTVPTGTFTHRCLGTVSGPTGTERLYSVINYR